MADAPCPRLTEVALPIHKLSVERVVAVVQVYNKRSAATFITAYVASPDTIRKIRSNPRW